MPQMIEINLRPDERTLRQFGFIAVAGFAGLAAIAWFEVLIFSFGLGVAREPLAIAFAAVAHRPRRIAAAGPLQLDHLGTHVGQNHGAKRAGHMFGQIQNLEPGERSLCINHRSYSPLG